MERKLAILFPGIGYTNDKPLLYYAAKLCEQRGYEIVRVEYHSIGQIKVKDRKVSEEHVKALLKSVEEQLKGLRIKDYEETLVIGKSIGTAVAAAYAYSTVPAAKCIWFTPIGETFRYLNKCIGVFHGTNDPWIKTQTVIEECKRLGYELYITEGANHSLERGNVNSDIHGLSIVMERMAALIDK